MVCNIEGPDSWQDSSDDDVKWTEIHSSCAYSSAKGQQGVLVQEHLAEEERKGITETCLQSTDQEISVIFILYVQCCRWTASRNVASRNEKHA